MRRFFLLPLLLALGCQDYLFEQKCPEIIKEQEITRAAAKPRPADILFVVDNSGSMADEQQNLAANFEAFISEIAGPDNDYRIAVVSTDQFNDLERGGELVVQYVNEPGTGVPAYVGQDRDPCVTTDIPKGCFRGPTANTRIIDSQVLDRATQISTFQQNVRVGSCGTGRETGLSAMRDALSKTNGCNSGFLRSEANLVIIFVSDEEDASDGPVQQYVEDLKNIKPLTQVRVAAIVGSVDGDGANCAIGVGAACGTACQGNAPAASTGRNCTPQTAPQICDPHEACITSECTSEPAGFWNDIAGSCLWCSYFLADDCCSALAGNRYVQFAKQIESQVNAIDPTVGVFGCRAETGARTACLIDSICQDSFAATLQRIAKDLVITTDYALEPVALNPAGVGVRLSGGRWGDGIDLVRGEDFTVSDDGSLLQLGGDKVPAEGETIDIFYVSDKIDSSNMPKGACN